MPELPEVETVLRTLEDRIQGRGIEKVEVIYPKIVECDPKAFCDALTGRHFLEFRRRGKYLLFGTEDVILVSHLRMEGKYYILPKEEPYDRHTHVVFHLDDGSTLRYHDTRKFGRMELLAPDIDLRTFHDLGPEPFSEEFSGDYVYREAKRRHVPIKSLLLDQSFAAGIGNIYADEICYACSLRPGRSSQRLRHADCDAIAEHTKRILAAAVRAGGTTIRSYTSSLGVTGLFQLECMVHTKSVCPHCGGQIKIKRIGGRSSYYCPHCQR
ncbi:MAG: DNA-formamidopyrimidine glycosylase [Solobacterium sp.]|nr:DNA-formamidopyrimidine glycosylase [Solobacterium sp.]